MHAYVNAMDFSSLEFDEALCDAFERGMGLTFARHNTCVLGTSVALATRVASPMERAWLDETGLTACVDVYARLSTPVGWETRGHHGIGE